MRKLKNGPESLFQKAAEEAGWEISKRGWPDFIMYRNGDVAVVEVKPDDPKSWHSYLKKDQMRVLKFLASKGIPAFHWTPKKGFTRIKP